MIKMKFFLLSVAVVLSISEAPVVRAGGSLTYGDKCSVPNAILQVFTNTEISESERCNTNQGLICTGTCTCPPTRVWDRGPFFGWFGGGSCISGANGPCAKGDRCVSNAVCGESIPLCFCMEGYHAHELHCISSQKAISAATSTRFLAGSLFTPVILVLLNLLK